MAVLRDIVAQFTIVADTKPLTAMDKAIDRSKKELIKMGQGIGVVGTAMAAGMYVAIDAASHAQETMSALKATFKDSSGDVIAWSNNMADYLGQSRFTLQETALKFGAFLGPVFRDSGVNISAMSEQLTELSGDLAAFYDTSNEEAMMRLFSGMSGETEAVRRLGIDISDTSLDDLNKSRGDNRRMASLTLQEKTALRFEKIMRDTEEKQGQANRELGQWAGQLRRAQEKLKEMTILLGEKFLPIALDILTWASAFAPMLEKLVVRSSIVEVAFKALAITALLVAAQYLLLNPAIAGATALIGSFFLVWEDLETTLKGGNSILGQFFQWMFDINNVGQRISELALAWVEGLDLMRADLNDFDEWMTYWLTGGLAGNKNPTNREDAGKRIEANRRVMGNIEKNKNLERYRAAAAGDGRAFLATYAGEQYTEEEAKQRFVQYREGAYKLNKHAETTSALLPWQQHASDAATGLRGEKAWLNPGANKMPMGITKGEAGSTMLMGDVHIKIDAAKASAVEIGQIVKTELNDMERHTAAALAGRR